MIFISTYPFFFLLLFCPRHYWATKKLKWEVAFYSRSSQYTVAQMLLRRHVAITRRLLVKVLRGTILSRRERQLLAISTADLFRRFPRVMFVVVPFIEFLLPTLLKLFPNIQPSNFQGKMKIQVLFLNSFWPSRFSSNLLVFFIDCPKYPFTQSTTGRLFSEHNCRSTVIPCLQEQARRKLVARMEYAKFLQDTSRVMAKEAQNMKSGDIQPTAEDFMKFRLSVSLQFMLHYI